LRQQSERTADVRTAIVANAATVAVAVAVAKKTMLANAKKTARSCLLRLKVR
jgi:hypothetical protein